MPAFDEDAAALLLFQKMAHDKLGDRNSKHYPAQLNKKHSASTRGIDDRGGQ